MITRNYYTLLHHLCSLKYFLKFLIIPEEPIIAYCRILLYLMKTSILISTVLNENNHRTLKNNTRENTRFEHSNVERST